MGTLANRLEKLEKDLYMLTAMHELMTDSSLENLDVPTRDVPSSSNCANSKLNISTRKLVSKIPSTSVNTVRPPVVMRCVQPLIGSASEDVHSKVQKEENESLKMLESIKSKLALEQRCRAEAEEAKQNLLSKLQEVVHESQLYFTFNSQFASQFYSKETELERENECKSGLLRLTLQMKHQLQEKCCRINSLETEMAKLKTEKEKNLEDVNTLRKNTEEMQRESQDLHRCLNSLKFENSRLEQTLSDLELKRKEEHRTFEQKEQSGTKQEQKLINQLNQLVVKCSQIDQARETSVATHKQLQNRLSEKESEAETMREKVFNLESTLERSSALHKCAIDKLQYDLEIQINHRNQKLSSCYVILNQTKEMLLKFNSEKRELEQSLEREVNSKQTIQCQLEDIQFELEAVQKAKRLESENSKSLLDGSAKALEELKLKTLNYQRTILKMKLGSAELGKRITADAEQYSQKMKTQEDKICILEEENTNLKKELKNLNDNFSILQKISEDQIRSIQKLKFELEESRKSESSLKSQLRNAEEAEESSRHKLSGQNQVVADLEDEVEYLQRKLSGLEDDLKKHSCEDFVESTYTKKLAHLESHIANQKSQCEIMIRNLISERDKANLTAKRALNKVAEVRSEFESMLSEVRSNSKQESLKLQVESRREVSEKNLQIQTLEAEMEKIRQGSVQIQQSLSQKIHQLQSALNICVGSFSQHPHQQVSPLLQQSFIPTGISQTLGSGSTFLG